MFFTLYTPALHLNPTCFYTKWVFKYFFTLYTPTLHLSPTCFYIKWVFKYFFTLYTPALHTSPTCFYIAYLYFYISTTTFFHSISTLSLLSISLIRKRKLLLLPPCKSVAVSIMKYYNYLEKKKGDT